MSCQTSLIVVNICSLINGFAAIWFSWVIFKKNKLLIELGEESARLVKTIIEQDQQIRILKSQNQSKDE